MGLGKTLQKILGIYKRPHDYWNNMVSQGPVRYWPSDKKLIFVGAIDAGIDGTRLSLAVDDWNSQINTFPRTINVPKLQYVSGVYAPDNLSIDVTVGTVVFDVAQANSTGWTDVITPDTRNITGAHIFLNSMPKYKGKSNDFWQMVLTHELGHALGLRHSPNDDDLMYGNCKVDYISSTDRNTLQMLYESRNQQKI